MAKSKTTFADFMRLHGFQAPQAVAGTPALDSIDRRLAGLEAELADHMPKDEEADHGRK